MENRNSSTNSEATVYHRSSNVELLRIIVMILIIAHHFVVNSGLALPDGPIYATPLCWKSIALLCMGAWGKIGINCFVIITGYYMCESHISTIKFFKLFLEVKFYQIVISLAFWLTGYESFSFITLFNIIIPITSIGTGFTNAYLVFFLFIPFLNILIDNITEKQFIYLLILCFSTYVLLGSIPFFSITINYVSWFIVVFFIAAYFRKYPKSHSNSVEFWRNASIAIIMIDLLSVVIGVWIGTIINRNIAYMFVSDSNALLAIVTGISVFMWFKNITIPYNKYINTIAASTFGVFLIHTQSDTMRKWLWQDVFEVVKWFDSNYIILYAILSVFIIFVVCTVIDQLRIRLIEVPLLQLWKRYSDLITEQYKKVEVKLFDIIKQI